MPLVEELIFNQGETFPEAECPIYKFKQSCEKFLVCSNLNLIPFMNEWNKWRNEANVRTPLLFREESENVHGNMQMIYMNKVTMKVIEVHDKVQGDEVIEHENKEIERGPMMI